LQEVFYQTDELSLQTNAHDISWIWIIILPTLGGLSIGLIYYFCSNKDRNGSVSDVIEGAALRNGRVSRRFGLISTAVSLITLTTGGSTGREGPVVHLGAVISTWVSDLIKVEGISARNLLGCAVAAAVSASFNAPIAGAIFALEVVLRHFAIHAFAPIAIASVVGTIIGRFFLWECNRVQPGH
jgi:CIC family chloride channel protein